MIEHVCLRFLDVPINYGFSLTASSAQTIVALQRSLSGDVELFRCLCGEPLPLVLQEVEHVRETPECSCADLLPCISILSLGEDNTREPPHDLQGICSFGLEDRDIRLGMHAEHQHLETQLRRLQAWRLF